MRAGPAPAKLGSQSRAQACRAHGQGPPRSSCPRLSRSDLHNPLLVTRIPAHLADEPQLHQLCCQLLDVVICNTGTGVSRALSARSRGGTVLTGLQVTAQVSIQLVFQFQQQR